MLWQKVSRANGMTEPTFGTLEHLPIYQHEGVDGVDLTARAAGFRDVHTTARLHAAVSDGWG